MSTQSLQSEQSRQTGAGTYQVQRALTLVMPIKDGAEEGLLALLEGLGQAPANPVHAALDKLQTVHFARFVLLENNTRLAVITTYDGDFSRYIMDFVDWLGPVFDQLLSFVDDWPPEHSVQTYRDEFLDYVRAHDLTCIGSLYSAYPELPVNDIVPLRPGAAG
jgi:hypothetical protein